MNQIKIGLRLFLLITVLLSCKNNDNQHESKCGDYVTLKPKKYVLDTLSRVDPKSYKHEIWILKRLIKETNEKQIGDVCRDTISDGGTIRTIGQIDGNNKLVLLEERTLLRSN